MKRSKVVFCETLADFDLGHDDDAVWQAQDFGCLGLTFHHKRNTLWTSTKCDET